jgi:hypothetical protein
VFKAICETLCSADKPGQLAQISWVLVGETEQ